MSPGWDEAFCIKVGVAHTRNFIFRPVQCISCRLSVPYMEKHMVLCKYTKTNVISLSQLQILKFSGVLDTTWEQISIYYNFNCTIVWMQTYLVLLDPKDETITFKTQKYLNKSMPVVHPVLQQWYEWCSHDINGVAIQGSQGLFIVTWRMHGQSFLCVQHMFCVIVSIKLNKTGFY